jgi:hypothetical protein
LRILAEILDSPGCHGEAKHGKQPRDSEQKAARKPEPQPEVGPQPGMERYPERKRKARPRHRAADQGELPLSTCP